MSYRDYKEIEVDLDISGMTVVQAIKELSLALEKIPEEFRNDVCIFATEYYPGDSRTRLEYYVPLTEEEINERLNKERQQKLAHYERLKREFGL